MEKLDCQRMIEHGHCGSTPFPPQTRTESKRQTDKDKVQENQASTKEENHTGGVEMERLLFFLCLCLAVMADSGDISFWKTSATFTCPEGGGKLMHGTKQLTSSTDLITYTLEYTDDTKGQYICEYKSTDTKKYHFYVKGYVCESCYELDGSLLAGIIVGDLLVTGGIVIIIYLWAQRRSAATTRVSAGRSAPPRSGPRGPAVPNRDYEPLNPRTRENATYAVPGMNRTG
ncbi:T-cell surface glycoprotein CD3 epsilon chain [Arapaima gigas]